MRSVANTMEKGTEATVDERLLALAGGDYSDNKLVDLQRFFVY